MYPYYQHFEKDDFDLTYDDILGIQTLYGGKTESTAKPRTARPRTIATIAAQPPQSTQAPFVQCTDIMKAAFTPLNRKLHVINDDKLYMLNDKSKEGIETGPLPVRRFFKELKVVDTVFQRPGDYGYLYVLHGDKFSVYYNDRLIRHPRRINHGFQNIKTKLKNVDAAFIWPANNKLYIFKGEQYWRLSRLSNNDYIADFGYPQNIAAKWSGLPKTIDTVFRWTNGKMYFVKDKLYYRWDDKRDMVHSGYPIRLTRSFLKC